MDYQEFLRKKQSKHIISGFELKESYFEQAKRNVAAAVLEKSQLTLI